MTATATPVVLPQKGDTVRIDDVNTPFWRRDVFRNGVGVVQALDSSWRGPFVRVVMHYRRAKRVYCLKPSSLVKVPAEELQAHLKVSCG